MTKKIKWTPQLVREHFFVKNDTLWWKRNTKSRIQERPAGTIWNKKRRVSFRGKYYDAEALIELININ